MRRPRPLDGFARRHATNRHCKQLHVYTVSCALGLLGSAQADVVVDGLLDEPEWQDAKVCSDWGRTQPYAQDQPRYRNEFSERCRAPSGVLKRGG